MSALDSENISIERLQEIAGDPSLAAKSIRLLLNAMRSEDEEIRAWASDGLQQIEQPDPALASELAELCDSTMAPIAGWACKLLSRLGEQATDYQSAVTHTLGTHPEITVRQEAALALGAIPQLDAASIAALRQAAKSTDARLSRLATQALQQQGSSRP